MISRRTFMTGAALGILGSQFISGGTAMASNLPPAIFYSPHADDTFLSMSTDILDHIDAGRTIIVVLMTAGGSDSMRRTLNGDIYGFGEPAHNPTLENYKDNPFTAEAVHAARINEFMSETGGYRLYSNNRVAVYNDVYGEPEGITQQRCYDIIKSYETRFPGSSHKTMSYTDPAPDHAACGKALQQLVSEGVIKDARYYVHRDYENDAVVQAKRPMIHRPTQAQADAIRRISRAYKSWNPASGSYSYGYISVRESFDTLDIDPHSVVHA